jgi:serine/threonine protein kinase
MSDESVSKSCPQCGAAVPDDAPGGFCPKCLMIQAAASTGGDGLSAEAKSPPSLEAVRAAFPQLEILQVIGQGGMGAVFKARQPKLNRFVALKILPERLAADPAFAERFAREGQMLARLNHPDIVAIHDFGECGGFFYLVMEYVDGVNLRQALRAGGFTPQQALGIVPKICEALQYAHEEGVLHRDIKPENILLDTKGRVKIADFGIAKFARENASGQPLTGAGATLGTPHYMAPEQIERPSDVDHRADIYSLGVVFYELLTEPRLPRERLADEPSLAIMLRVSVHRLPADRTHPRPGIHVKAASQWREYLGLPPEPQDRPAKTDDASQSNSQETSVPTLEKISTTEETTNSCEQAQSPLPCDCVEAP